MKAKVIDNHRSLPTAQGITVGGYFVPARVYSSCVLMRIENLTPNGDISAIVIYDENQDKTDGSFLPAGKAVRVGKDEIVTRLMPSGVVEFVRQPG